MEDIEFVKEYHVMKTGSENKLFKCFLKCAEFHSVALRWAVWKERVQPVWASSRLFIGANDYTAINHKKKTDSRNTHFTTKEMYIQKCPYLFQYAGSLTHL